MPTPLEDACGVAARPTSLCVRVFERTHDEFLASSSDWLIAKPARILLVVAVALLVRALARRAIDRLVQGVAHGRVVRGLSAVTSRAPVLSPALSEASPLAVERRRQRAETVGSVLRSISGAVIVGLALLTVLSELGVDLAPIVASAGIVGVAVGFGAQNLVKDFLSGLFLILEDAYGVGDVVDVGVASGVVESVGLRSTRVRDDTGVLWHVRNGEIARVGNTSQGLTRLRLDVMVAHGTDLAAARAVMEATAAEVWEVPEARDALAEEPTVAGAVDVSKDGVTLRLVAPHRHDAPDVDRMLRERVVMALGAAGVQLAGAPATPAGRAPAETPAHASVKPPAKAPAAAKTSAAAKAPAAASKGRRGTR